jgi:hypothetical protein
MIRKAILYAISPFAMVANKVNWRFGRPYRQSFEVVKPHIRHLAPGMVILSHKDYELTNLFINGYWTHVAMVACENEIIEAIGKGVVKTQADKFFSTLDDFIILEPKFCSRCSMSRAVEYANRYVGYPYNFKFMQNDSSFTCIDLICRAYSLSINNEKSRSITITGLLNYITEDVVMPESILKMKNAWNIVELSNAQIA